MEKIIEYLKNDGARITVVEKNFFPGGSLGTYLDRQKGNLQYREMPPYMEVLLDYSQLTNLVTTDTLATLFSLNGHKVDRTVIYKEKLLFDFLLAEEDQSKLHPQALIVYKQRILIVPSKKLEDMKFAVTPLDLLNLFTKIEGYTSMPMFDHLSVSDIQKLRSFLLRFNLPEIPEGFPFVGENSKELLQFKKMYPSKILAISKGVDTLRKIVH